MVSLRFAGILNDKLRGFYRSTFEDEAGTERVIATTQFEATDARRAFPCWDEPDCKAVFADHARASIPALEAVSNAAVVSDEVADGVRRGALRRHDGDVDLPRGLHRRAPRGHRPRRRRRHAAAHRVPAREAATSRRSGSRSASFSLRYLADYFDIPYAGDSMDLVAIPDFAFGAMENLGCVTFRETLAPRRPGRARRRASSRTSSTSSPTSWPTCGSATS